MLRVIKSNQNTLDDKVKGFRPVSEGKFAIVSVILGVIGAYVGYFVTLGGGGISFFNIFVIAFGVTAWRRKENRILTIAGLTLGIAPILIFAIMTLLWVMGLIE